MRKGLGMWVMSKLVLIIFLFSLMYVMTMFLSIYQEKVIQDTARSQTIYWSEVASSTLGSAIAGDSVIVADRIQIEDTWKQYTALVRYAESGDENNGLCI